MAHEPHEEPHRRLGRADSRLRKPPLRLYPDGVPKVELNELLSGAVGALGVALLTIFYDRVRAWLDRRRERKALLRIIDSEVYENMAVLEGMIDYPELADQYPSRAAVVTDAWDQAQGRLAQLLPSDHITLLVRHYASVRRIRAVLEDPERPTAQRKGKDMRVRLENVKKKRLVLLSSLANSACEDGEAIRQKGKKYIKTLPDYFPKPEDTEDQAEDNDETNDEASTS